jgi:DNA repair protein SbcC/Rad50
MKIEKLRLKGFIGIKRGLGLDEIEIDFSNIDGLIAFAGQNGLGKSTILENLHPFSTLASRSGALFNHCFRRDAEKELSFTYNGSRYRTLLKIDSQSGKSEGFIYKNDATKSETTGKIREYDKYIVNLLGTENMFFHSVFCAQNATKLSDMTTGELKTLLSEFLNLDKLVGWEVDSKDQITAVTGQIEQVDKQIMALGLKETGIDKVKDNLAREKVTLDEHETAMDALKKKRVEYQADLEQLRDKKAKQEVLLSQKANLEARIKELQDTLAREQKDADAELNGLRDAYKELQAQIKENEDLLKQADEINTAAGKESEINNKIELLTKTIDLTTAEIAEIQDTVHKIESRLQDLRAKKKELANDAELVRLEHAIAQTVHMIKQGNGQLSALEVRDKDCQSSTCSFIVAALKAKEELPKLEAECADLSRQKQERAGQIERETAEIEEQLSSDEHALRLSKDNLKGRTETNTEDRKNLATARMDLNKVKELAGKKTALAVAQSQYESITKQMEENTTKGKELKVKWENRKADLDGSMKDAENTLSDIRKQIDNDIDRLIGNKAAVIGLTDRELSDKETEINTTRANIMKLEAELSSMAAVEKELKAANGEKARLQQDIADWTYLKNACGKNGLQAMEIDSAAPIITTFANDLLTQTFGPLFTIRFRTVNDDGKECLDIIVINEDGEEVLLDNLSGGQKIWILMSLRLAMTLLSKEKSGKNFETAFFDEMDGPLDPENAVNFVNLYKSFMDSGKFETIFFISHKPECRSLADNNLMFAPGNNPAWQ